MRRDATGDLRRPVGKALSIWIKGRATFGNVLDVNLSIQEAAALAKSDLELR